MIERFPVSLLVLHRNLEVVIEFPDPGERSVASLELFPPPLFLGDGWRQDAANRVDLPILARGSRKSRSVRQHPGLRHSGTAETSTTPLAESANRIELSVRTYPRRKPPSSLQQRRPSGPSICQWVVLLDDAEGRVEHPGAPTSDAIDFAILSGGEGESDARG
jgi:hypothetical protein